MWNSSGKVSSSDIVNRQKQCHIKAFALISRALELDEQNAGKIEVYHVILKIFCCFFNLTIKK